MNPNKPLKQKEQASMKPASSNNNGQQRHSRSNSKQFRRNNSNNNSSIEFNEEFFNHNNDRLTFLIFNSIGAHIKLLNLDGTLTHGTLQNIDPTDLSIFVETSDGEQIIQKFDDLIDFEIENIDLSSVETPAKASTPAPAGNFKTDSDISKSRNFKQRSEIEKWTPDVDTNLTSLSLEDTSSTAKGGWDQFQTNEEKFGIKSEFDESFYTTTINKDDPDYQKKLAEATKLAAEIESQPFNGNAHLAEERGIKFDDSGLDEEDKYSGVKYKSNETGNDNILKKDALFESLLSNKFDNSKKNIDQEANKKYVPVHQRNRIQNIDPSIISASQKSQPAKVAIPQKPAQPTNTENKNINNQNEINSLKEFSQTFKIPSKFPQDLLPIVTKDKHKQEEIIKNSSSPSSSGSSINTKPEDKSAKPEPTTTSTAATSAPADKPPEKQPTVIKKKFDPAKAQTFKLNPNAPSFTPSASAISPPIVPPQPIVVTPNIPTPTSSHPNSNNSTPRLPHQPPHRNSKRVPTAQSYFRDRVPVKRDTAPLSKDFNFFKACFENFKKNATSDNDKFYLEKPYTTSPSWIQDPSTSSPVPQQEPKSFRDLFAQVDLRYIQQPIPQPMPQHFFPMPVMYAGPIPGAMPPVQPYMPMNPNMPIRMQQQQHGYSNPGFRQGYNRY